MPNVSPRASQLPEDVGMHVDELRKACPGIDQVWLMRHRTDEHPAWDLLAFADRRCLEKLRIEPTLRRPDVHLLVVVDGNRFEAASGEASAGTLSDIDWRLDDAASATFVDGGPLAGGEARKPDGGNTERSTAVRVR
ncbi:MAG TPA: hypothetical protein VFV10_10990 [Gammaproteobacteria bacterium]|nr:hypothetical protein [Gammaproteobacteria bacterium]